MAFESIRSETTEDGVLVLTLNDPTTRNALSGQLNEELEGEVDRYGQDPALRVLVITGADRSEIAKLNPRRVHGIIRKPFDRDELAAVVVACAEIRSRKAFDTMAIATMIAGSPLLALLRRFSA